MSGIDEQCSRYPDCPRCVEGHFWIGKVQDSVYISKYIYFNPTFYRGKEQKLKLVVIYDVVANVNSDGRYATEEEIKETYDIICASCKNMATEDIVSNIKKVAIQHIRGIGH